MNALKTLFLLNFLICSFLLSSCQEDDFAGINDHNTGRFPTGKAPNPVPELIPPSSVVLEDYAMATSWTATWNYPFWTNRRSLAGIFNTSSGTFHSYNSIKGDELLIAQADMYLLFGTIQSLEENFYIDYSEAAPATRFKPSSLSLIGFHNAVQNNPALFQQEYENSIQGATEFQPYNYPTGEESGYYSSGDIYLFKTDSQPARYGAIRIIEGSDIVGGTVPRVIQIVLADSNIIGSDK
jgi:hypothetical protein